MNTGVNLKPVAKPVVLTVDQIDKSDHHYNLFLPDSEEYCFTDIIIVQKTGRRYRIIDGFKIINAGLPVHHQFPAICFPESASSFSILSKLVETKVKKRPLFPIEIASVFQMARQDGVSDIELMTLLFPLFGLKSNAGLIDRYLQFLLLTSSIIKYMIEKNAPVKTWLFILKFTQNEQLDLGDLIRLRPTLSIFEEIVSNLYEIQKRENLSQTDLLSQLQWKTILTDENLESKERIGQVRNAISRRRFPLLSTHKDNVEAALRQITLPENAGIHYNDSFEKKELRLNWCLHTKADIKKMSDFYTDDTIRKIQQLLDTF